MLDIIPNSTFKYSDQENLSVNMNNLKITQGKVNKNSFLIF